MALKKEKDETNPKQQKLYVTQAIRCESRQPITLMAAWWYMIMTIDKDSGWMAESPAPNSIVCPDQSNQEIASDRYTSIPLEGLMQWKTIISTTEVSAIALGSFMNMENVIFKSYDGSLNQYSVNENPFQNEIAMYKNLEELQGSVIPRLIAYGTLGGFLHVLVMEHVGRTIDESESEEREDEINDAVKKIHSKGIEHGQ
ncbi:hypothetical protein HDU91_003507, partial [Kappamyces sp. JEL0680]